MGIDHAHSFQVFHHFGDPQKNDLHLYSELSLRLYRALSPKLCGNCSQIHDQWKKCGCAAPSHVFGSIFSKGASPRHNGY